MQSFYSRTRAFIYPDTRQIPGYRYAEILLLLKFLSIEGIIFSSLLVAKLGEC